MKTSGLVVVLALLLVGSVTTQAQPVSRHDASSVGYANVDLKPGFNLISNPLDAGAGNNTVSRLFAKISAIPDGTTVHKYEPGVGFQLQTFEFGAWSEPDFSLAPGEGCFVRLAGDAGKTITFVGEVLQGEALTVDLPAGFALVSSLVPSEGRLSTDLKFPVADGDIIYQYDNATGFKVTMFDFGVWGAGRPEDEPYVRVGEAFWSRKLAPTQWVRSFRVSPF